MHDVMMFGSGHDLDLRSKFQLDLLMSYYTSFDAAWWEKHHGYWIIILATLCRSYAQKTIWGNIVYFYNFWPLEVKPLTWGQIWRHRPGRAVNGLSFDFFRAALAPWVHELERLKLRIVEMVENRKQSLMTSGDLTFDLTLKMTEVLS